MKCVSYNLKIRRKNCGDLIGWELGLLDYNSSYRIRYGINKANAEINRILLALQQKAKLSTTITMDERFLFFSYNTLNDPSDTVYLPFMVTQSETQYAVKKVIEFLEGIAFPLLEKFEDLREIDKIINGGEPWDTDWQKPYVLGGYFRFIRLIIAKLAGNKNYEHLVDLRYGNVVNDKSCGNAN